MAREQRTSGLSFADWASVNYDIAEFVHKMYRYKVRRITLKLYETDYIVDMKMGGPLKEKPRKTN